MIKKTDKETATKNRSKGAKIGLVVLHIIMFCAIILAVIYSSIPFVCLCPEYLQSIPYWLWGGVLAILILLFSLKEKNIYLFIALAVMLGICVAFELDKYTPCACADIAY